MKKDYVKQLEAANAELQRKLEEFQEEMDVMRLKVKEEFANGRLVCCITDNSVISSDKATMTPMCLRSSLVVAQATREEMVAIHNGYDSAKKYICFYKSIKDRNHKNGSFYDIDMLISYSKGVDVTTYQI